MPHFDLRAIGNLGLWPYAKVKRKLTTKNILTFNPISGRLLATPISGRGWAVYDPLPLDFSRSIGPIFKIETTFDCTKHDLHFQQKNVKMVVAGA